MKLLICNNQALGNITFIFNEVCAVNKPVV